MECRKQILMIAKKEKKTNFNHPQPNREQVRIK
jgi:hypothetical protein